MVTAIKRRADLVLCTRKYTIIASLRFVELKAISPVKATVPNSIVSQSSEIEFILNLA